MKILGTITSKLADHDARLDDMAPWADILVLTTELLPGPNLATTDWDCPRVAVLESRDQFDGMEEQVCWRVAEHLKGAHPTYLRTSEKDSGDDEKLRLNPRKNTRAPLVGLGWQKTQSSSR